MKSIVFTRDFDGNLPIFKNKKMGEKMEVNDENAASLILRGIAELDTTGGQESVELDHVEKDQKKKELKETIKTKEEKHYTKIKTK